MGEGSGLGEATKKHDCVNDGVFFLSLNIRSGHAWPRHWGKGERISPAGEAGVLRETRGRVGVGIHSLYLDVNGSWEAWLGFVGAYACMGV